MRTICRTITILLVLASLHMLPGPAPMATPVTGVALSFPEGATLTVELSAEALAGQNAVLLWKPARASVWHVATARTVAAGDDTVQATATLNFQQDFVPAGQEIDYRWVADTSPWTPLTAPDTFAWLDNRWDWSSRTVDRVTVHTYGDGTADATAILASVSETVATMHQAYGISVSEPVSIWAYPDYSDFRGTQQQNSREAVAGFTYPEFGVIAMILPASQPAEIGRVVPHELSHQVLAQATANAWNSPPLWFDEGLAVYLQTGGKTSYERMLERAMREDALYGLDALGYAFPYDPAGASLAYAQSWSMVAWLHDAFGDSGVARLIEAFGSGQSWNESLHAALGIDLETAEAQWRTWLKAQTDASDARLSGEADAPHDAQNGRTLAPSAVAFVVDDCMHHDLPTGFAPGECPMAAEARQQQRARILDPAAIERKLALNTYNVDADRAHIRIIDHQVCLSCVHQQCINCCPANCYVPQTDGTVLFSYEGCVECGTCRIVCNEFDNIEWTYPRGGFGIQYRLG